MRIFLVFVLFIAGSMLLYSQSAEDQVIRLKQTVTGAGKVEDPGENPPSGTDRETLSGFWNFSVGTHFSAMKGYGSGIGFFAAPVYTLPLNTRWSLHTGLIATSFTGFNLAGAGETAGQGGVYGLALFGAASYRMSERLMLHGSGVKQLLISSPVSLVPYGGDRFSLGASYRLGENVTIGASFQMGSSQGFGSPFLFQEPVPVSPYGW